jgi:septum formation protein
MNVVKTHSAYAKVKLILASSSPRRKEILEKEGFEFEIMVPDNVEENNIYSDPVSHALELSRKKVESVAKRLDEGLILGADTIVVLDGQILGKPKDKKEAQIVLKKMSGKAHKVYTGLTLINKSNDKVLSDYDSTEVFFNQLKDEDILNYIATGEPLDKAGAYGIQGMGSFLVNHIEGNLDNVIGLPVKKLKEMLKRIV